MRIAFYAPLKSPDHPVPSGDRLMARMLCAALTQAGHDVTIASRLRSYCRDPDDHAAAAAITAAATSERHRIAAEWPQDPPNVWVTYHPYYKSPDLIGPPLCEEFGLPYVTIESSFAPRRNLGLWAISQTAVLNGLTQAAVNICLTARDRAGIVAAAPAARLADLPPFIDPRPYLATRPEQPGPVRLITVAMMRPGDKFDSFAMLAQALSGLTHLNWRLTIVGAGPMEPQVRALFADVQDRVDWAGLCDPARVAELLTQSDLYLWPGYGEAYGLAYLEAQAAGLPVVAQQVAGVPEVVTPQTGLLTAPGDLPAYRAAVASLIIDTPLRQRLGQTARARVLARHSFQAASARLQQILDDVVNMHT
jgi:glycosyltransferase involved in cell wall biosynthesis